MSRKLSLSLCGYCRVRISEGMLCLELHPGTLCADCCRPALFEISGMGNARWSYMLETVGQLESTHPQAVVDVLAHTASMFTVGPDGIARGADSGTIDWVPRQASAQLTEAFANPTWGSPSAAAISIGLGDVFTMFSKPYAAELPAAILEIIVAEPSGAVGLSYCRYVKSTLVPAIRRVAVILRSHSTIIEWPSIAWQKEKFPSRSNAEPSNGYATHWLGALAVANTCTASHDSLPRDLSRLTVSVRQNNGQAMRTPGRRSWQPGTRASSLLCGPGSGCH